MARLEAASAGRRIAALRRERGWSQSQLAAALATASGRSTITREEVSRWEHDRRTPTPYWLSHLAAVLRVPARAAPRGAGPLAGGRDRDRLDHAAIENVLAPLMAAGHAAALR